MKRFMKRVMTLALAGTMTMGMAANVFAADASNSQVQNSGGTQFSLTKIYSGTNYSSTDTKIVNSPAQDFEFTITPEKVYNAGTVGAAGTATVYTASTMPLLGASGDAASGSSNSVTVDTTNRKTTVKIHANEGDAGKSSPANLTQAITIPSYTGVGDFWYKVTEAATNTVGVTNTTNDTDGSYYIHVQVVNNSDNTGYDKTVTIHQTLPSETTDKAYNAATTTRKNDGNKVMGIENTYKAGTLAITKTVTGNMSDTTKRFNVKVTFTNSTGNTVKSDITYNINGTANADSSKITASEWTGTSVTKEIAIANGETVTFKNIPYGITYTVQEADYTGDAEGYDTASYSKTDSAETDSYTLDATGSGTGWSTVQATGTVDDASDGITITNNKATAIDVGVVTNNSPYIAMFAVAAVAFVIFIRRRRSSIEE